MSQFNIQNQGQQVPHRMIAFYVPWFGQDILKKACPTEGEIIKPSEMHISICLMFNGNQKKIDQVVQKEARHIKPLSILAKEVTYFPPTELNRNLWVVHCAVESPDLMVLHDELQNMLIRKKINVDKRFPEFKPHITLRFCHEKPQIKQIKPFTMTMDTISVTVNNDRKDFKLG